MPIQQELLNGGLVTARDTSLLKEGELTQADDCVLRSRTPAVWKTGGRTRFGQPSAGVGAVLGLRHLAFDNQNDVLLAHVGTTLYTAPYTGTGLAGTFTAQSGTFNNGTNKDYLDVVQYAGIFYVLNANNFPYRVGYTTPQASSLACTIAGDGVSVSDPALGAAPFMGVTVGQFVSGTGIPAGAVVTQKTSNTSIKITASTPGTPITITFSAAPFLTTRLMGLAPVSSWGGVAAGSVVTTTGSWPTYAGMGAGVYWFLYTEMFMPGSIDTPASGFVESGFLGTPLNVTIAAPITQGVTVTRANIVNTQGSLRGYASHWQVYMSGPTTDNVTSVALSTFQRVGSPISVDLTSMTFANVLSSETKYPTIVGIPGTGASPGPGAFRAQGSSFSNPTNMLVDDSTFASSNTPDHSSIFLGGAAASLGMNFTNTGATVVGMQVKICASAPRGCLSYVTVATTNALKTSVTYSLNTPGGWFYPAYLGSANDTMSPSSAWLPANVPDLCIIWDKPAGALLYVQSINLTVYYSTTQVNKNGVFFRVITTSSQAGVTISSTSHLPPPTANTGDVYDGQLVVNDLASPSLIRYSLPDEPEYFPALYYINFESKYKDRVTCIRRVNNALVVGLQSSIKRVNYLPRESDAEFDRGRAQEDITTDHGIAGAQAATLFTMPGGGTLLAYVSSKGIHITDGNTSRELNNDLDWATTFNLGTDADGVPYLERCMLVNYAAEYALRLAYVPTGATTVTKYLQFSYHPMHMKNGEMPAMGPCQMNARAFCTAILGGTSKILSGHLSDGYVYAEDNGTTSDDATALPTPIVKTRLLLPRGVGGQGRIQRLYLRVGANGAGDAITGTGRFTVGSQRQNINEAVTTAFAPVGLSSTTGGTVVAHVDSFGEGLILSIAKPAAATSAMRIDMLAYQVEDGGQESHR